LIRIKRLDAQNVPRGTYSFYWVCCHVDQIINSKVLKINLRRGVRGSGLGVRARLSGAEARDTRLAPSVS
jgi:hypothetical protein